MIDREQLSLRQAVAWLGGTITVRGAPDCSSSRSLTRTGGVRVSGRRVDQTRLTALDPAVAGTSAIFDRWQDAIGGKWIPLGCMVLLAGRESIGKTTIA